MGVLQALVDLVSDAVSPRPSAAADELDISCGESLEEVRARRLGPWLPAVLDLQFEHDENVYVLRLRRLAGAAELLASAVSGEANARTRGYLTCKVSMFHLEFPDLPTPALPLPTEFDVRHVADFGVGSFAVRIAEPGQEVDLPTVILRID